jgi:dihydroorotase
MSKLREFILRGARVVDPARGVDAIADVAVKDGRIVDRKACKKPEIINLRGKVVAPGFIDLHVHLRQPGGTQKESIRTGTMAAAAGGFTTIVAMPNTSPPADTPGAIEYLRRHAEREGVVRVLPCGCLTKGSLGEEMTGIGGLKAAGVVALSDDGRCVQNHELMRHLLEYSRTFDLPIFDHCQDNALAGDGVMHEGYQSTLLGLRGMPAAAEEMMIVRDIILAELTGGKIHIQHVSTAGGVRMLRDARRRGVAVTAEVTPHHLALTDELLRTFDTDYKVNPPLRSEEHRRALLKGLKDGTIGVIATDHAPHTPTDKLVEFDYAPFGILGLETAVPVCLTELLHKEVIDLPALVAAFTVGPAAVLGLDLGTLAEGSPADITILDPAAAHVIDRDTFFSRSRNTPFHGYRATGRVEATIVAGDFVFSRLPKVEGKISREG